MKQSFDRLAYEVSICDLKISPANRKYIEKLIEHLSGYVSETRIKKYKHSLTRFADLVEKDFDKLTYEEIRKAGGIINKSDFSIKTKQDIISEVKTAFKIWFGKKQYFPEVVGGLKPPTAKSRLMLPQEMPTEKDVYRMVKACNNSRDKFFIALIGLDSALRPVEARNIKWGDIKKDKYGHYITIRTAKKSGDKETRTVRIIKSEPYYIKWNQDYPAEKKDSAFVFVNFSDLNQITQGTITALFTRLKKKLKMKKLYPYLLRHQFITNASKDNRWTIPILKKFIGHSLNSNTISEYQHFGDEDLKDAQLKVNGIIKDKKEKQEERKPIQCPKCKKSNEYDSEFCSYCNMALSQKRVLEIDEMLKKNNELMFKQVKEMIEGKKSK